MQPGRVEEASSGGHAQGAAVCPCQLVLEPFSGGHPMSDPPEKSSIGTAEPQELRGPEGTPQHAPSTTVHRLFGKGVTEGGGIRSAPGISPSDDLGERFTACIRSYEAVPEARDPDSADLAPAQGTIGTHVAKRLSEAML